MYYTDIDKECLIKYRRYKNNQSWSWHREVSGCNQATQLEGLVHLLEDFNLNEQRDKWICELDYTDEFTGNTSRKFIDNYLLEVDNGSTRWKQFVFMVFEP